MKLHGEPNMYLWKSPSYRRARAAAADFVRFPRDEYTTSFGLTPIPAEPKWVKEINDNAARRLLDL